MSGLILDIEKRYENAASELLKADPDLLALVDEDDIQQARKADELANYPAACFRLVGAFENLEHSGWYQGALSLTALTYRADDGAGTAARAILGALRAWAQQADLATKLNATAAAQSIAGALEVRYFVCDGMAYDLSDDRIVELGFDCMTVFRPSQEVTE